MMTDQSVQKPCFYCGELAPTTFDPEEVFDEWSSRNEIISSDRARFDGMRERLRWASLDETDTGAHPECALKWAVKMEGFATRYPAA